MKRQNALTAWALVTLTALLLPACSTGPYAPKAGPTSPEIAGDPVVFLDKDLVRTLTIDKAPIVTTNPNGIMEIQVGLRNKTNDETLQIQVQTIFRDASGRVLYSQIGSQAAWDALTLTPNQMVPYTQRALTKEAASFTIRIRYLAREDNAPDDD